jgi:threonine dehydrogenase-like Zn-dependent dehydrogenase
MPTDQPIGTVEEVGSASTNLTVGDRIVVPFQVSCGH